MSPTDIENTTEEQVLRKVLELRGYIILESAYPLKLGRVVKGPWFREGKEEEVVTNQPFCVVAETDFEDLLEQHRSMGVEPSSFPPKRYKYFYRVVTD